ncbi:MAG TPA: hypothetical protein V6D08_13520 [Candidatus Obscuribacterales bacterium]
MSKSLKITGFAVCPAGDLRGHDADEQRANQMADGRVYCIFCGIVNPLGDKAAAVRRLPAEVKAVIASLISTTDPDEEVFQVAGVTEGSGNGAVAQGFGPEDIGTTVSLARGRYADEKVEISFTGRDLEVARSSEPTDGDGQFGAAYDRKRVNGIVPVGVDQAATKLAAAGFRLVNANIDGLMRSLTLVKGRQIPGKTTLLGIRAQVTWIVD